jgi:hypothetical protein
MKLSYVALCERLIIDEQTKKVSIIDVFDTLNTIGVPFMAPDFVVFASFDKEQSEDTIYNTSLSITLNNKSVFEQPIPIDFKGKNKSRMIVRINQLIIHEEGNLMFKINNSEVNHEFEVSITAP